MLSVALICRRRSFDVEAAFDVAAGEMFGLFGPSGAGKSTVLEAIAGLIRPLSGRISLGDQVLTELGGHDPVVLPPWERRVGFLTQESALFPHLSVEANIAYGLPGHRIDDHSRSLIDALKIGHLLCQPIQRISGGERRRVALAQTLAVRPKALLLDEPFAALDAPVRAMLGDWVHDLQEREGLPMIFVSHDLEEVQRLADRVAAISEGKLLQIGTPSDIVLHPVTPAVARLVGYTSFLRGDLVGLEGMVAMHPDRSRLGYYPRLGPIVHGEVERIVPHRTTSRVWVRIDRDTLIDLVLGLEDIPPEKGHQVQITLVDPPVFPSAVTPRSLAEIG